MNVCSLIDCMPVWTRLSCTLYMSNHCLPSGNVAGQLTPAPPTCPGDTFTFTCNVTGGIYGFTTWKVGGNSECVLVHRSRSSSICGPGHVFTANSGTEFGPGTSATSFTSTLSGTADPALNGTRVECFGPANNVDSGNRVGNSNLIVIGVLSLIRSSHCQGLCNVSLTEH